MTVSNASSANFRKEIKYRREMIGLNIAAARRLIGMTRLELATEICVHLETIVGIESGHKSVKCEVIGDIASVLETTVADLLRY